MSIIPQGPNKANAYLTPLKQASCNMFPGVCPNGTELQTHKGKNTMIGAKCKGNPCVASDEANCCSTTGQCVGTYGSSSYAYEKNGEFLVNHTMVGTISNKVACGDNSKFLKKNAMGKTFQECCGDRESCASFYLSGNGKTTCEKTAVGSNMPGSNSFSFFTFLPGMNAHGGATEETTYCAGEKCAALPDATGDNKHCCFEAHSGAPPALCSTVGLDFCDSSTHVLQKYNKCAGNTCGEGDRAVCCKERAKCSTLDHCSQGRIPDQTKNDTYCFGSMCNAVDDSWKCCTISSTNAKCGGNDQDINFAIKDHGGTYSYLRWGNKPCVDGIEPQTFVKDASCAGNTCKDSDSATCCVKRAKCSSGNTQGELAAKCTATENSSKLYFVLDADNTYCSGATCDDEVAIESDCCVATDHSSKTQTVKDQEILDNTKKKYIAYKNQLKGCKTRDDGRYGVFRYGNTKASGDWAIKKNTEDWDNWCDSATQSECPRWGGAGGALINSAVASGGVNAYRRCSWYCESTPQKQCPEVTLDTETSSNSIYTNTIQNTLDSENLKMIQAETSFNDGYRCTSLQGYPWDVRCRDGWKSARANACHGCAIIPQNKIECEKVAPSICKWKKTL